MVNSSAIEPVVGCGSCELGFDAEEATLSARKEMNANTPPPPPPLTRRLTVALCT
jgi:hypothetical protein